MNRLWNLKRGTEEGCLPVYPGFGSSGKSFLIDNLLGSGESSVGPLASGSPLTRTSSPLRVSGPMGREHGAGWGSQQVTPKDWRSIQANGFIQQPYTGFLAVSSRFPPPFRTPCGGSGSLSAPPAGFPKGGNLVLWAPDVNPRSRKGILRRAVFSEEQRRELERTFRKQKYIGKADRNKLAADLRLKESQVKIWFQNQRMKWRNTKEREVLCGRPLTEEPSSGSDRSREQAPERSSASKVPDTSKDPLKQKQSRAAQSLGGHREQLKTHSSANPGFTKKNPDLETAKEHKGTEHW
ncbi:hypothetical protein AAFF_G00356190 [Aldrovandia affinis]|uniref:Homeobox domain-containing protein n=1 Tax=Aldrovandia affinis TaxID=143900 RepID=A0AAD7TA25_9TELE|nr:hypothetical protein AAFF_G00356190 [Aldrovandia affinis]